MRFWQILPYLFALVATVLVSDHPFFWDTIQLGSKHAHWYYEQGLRFLLLPPEIDSGHPPVFGMYLAVCWLLFGKSLLVSHLAMLPFLWLLIWAGLRLGRQLVSESAAPWLLLLLFADPVLAGQAVLISPDVVLIAGFLWLLSGVLEGRSGWILVAALLTGLVSMRGMVVVFMVFVWEVLRMQGVPWPSRLKRALWPYLPAGLLALAFLAYHYVATGWIGKHDDSPWAGSFERVDDLATFVRVLAVTAWRLLDYGRFAGWGLLFFLSLTGKNKQQGSGKSLFILLLLSLFFVITPQLPYKYLMAHRYLLPVFISLNLLVWYLLFSSPAFSKKKKILLYSLLLTVLVSGNFWVYPKKTAQGWDSTLAHLPHYSLRADALAFLRKQEIPLEKVGTAFPEIGPLKYKDLSDDTEGMSPKDLEQQKYILYANTMNDFSDTEIDALEGKDWTVWQRWERAGVCFILYRKNEADSQE